MLGRVCGAAMSSSCKKPFAKGIIDQAYNHLSTNLELYGVPLRTTLSTHTYISYYMRSISYEGDLINHQLYTAIKRSLRSHCNFTPPSIPIICQSLLKFDFEGDEGDILNNIHEYIVSHPNSFTQQQFHRSKLAFMQLMLSKTSTSEFKSLQQHIKPTNKTHHQNTSHITNIHYDQPNNKIYFQYHTRGTVLKCKILGLAKSNVKPNNNQSAFPQIGQQIFNIQQSLRNNSQCVIVQVQPSSIDQHFYQSNQFQNLLQPYPLQLDLASLDSYLDRFQHTEGILYHQKQIDLLRSTLLHLTQFNQAVILYPYQPLKRIKSVLNNNQKYTLPQLRQNFAYLRLVFFHEMFHYIHQKHKKGCSNSKDGPCEYTANLKKPYQYLQKLTQEKQISLLRESEVIISQLLEIIRLSKHNSYCVIVDHKYLHQIHQALTNNKYIAVGKHSPQTQQVELHRKAIIEVIYGQQLDKDRQPQMKKIKEGYHKMMYPIKLSCK